MIKYIHGTIGLQLILSINKSGNIKWYVDTEFAMHKDMMIQTGGFMTMRSGGTYVQPSKQKLNAKTSTYDKLVRVDYVLTQVIWT